MIDNKKSLPKPEFITLVVCLSVIVLFVLLVWAVSGQSLGLYTIPQALLAFLIAGILILKPRSKMPVRISVFLAILGAISALWLVSAYLPWYLDYIGNR